MLSSCEKKPVKMENLPQFRCGRFRDFPEILARLEPGVQVVSTHVDTVERNDRYSMPLPDLG